MPALSCPPRERLQAFGSGDLPAVLFDQIGEHVLHCTNCQETLESVSSQGLATALLYRGERDPFVQERECIQAVAEIQALEPEAAAEPLPSRLGQYQLLEQLGRGGMGTVYKALHPFLKRQVALKVLPVERTRDPEAVARFRREMEAIGKLHHPNIVQATDAGECEGRHYLVMEYVDGCDLDRLVRRRGPLPVVDACEAVRQAALGLQHAYEHGLVHRDIKPSNLIVAASGQVQMLDLGLALLRGELPADGLTSAGQVMGTLDYMAPEQAFDAHQVDIRADVYSLGCTLYFLLTGQPPFAGSEYRQPLTKMLAHASEPVPPLGPQRPEAPAELNSIVQRMMAKKPADRFATPQDVAASLMPLAAGHGLAELQRLTTNSVDTAALNPQSPGSPCESPSLTASRARSYPWRTAAAWLALSALGVSAALWLAGVVVRISTPAGMLVIEADQPAVEVFVNGQKAVLKPRDGGEPITVEVDEGRHELKVTKGGFETFTRRFTIESGRDKVVQVHLEPLGEPAKKTASPGAGSARESLAWVLRQGGRVILDRKPLANVADLPGGSLGPVDILLSQVTAQNGFVPTALTDEDLEKLRDLPNSVRILDLRNHAYSDAGIDRLTRSPFAATLTTLNLSSPKLTDAALESIARCLDLKTLSLSSPHFTGAGFKSLRNLPGLTEVSVSYSPVQDAALAQLVGLKLRSLSLRGSPITNEGMKYLRALTELEALSLYGAESVSDQGANHLVGLDRLRLLDLAGAQITDQGLTSLAKLPKLKTLYLTYSLVTDEGIKTLSGMKGLTQLSVRATKVTPIGIERLRTALPQCTVLGDDATSPIDDPGRKRPSGL